MLTVLFKEWLELLGDYIETTFEATRVEYYPHGMMHAENPALKVFIGSDEMLLIISASQKVYVMNSAGKTVARYVGSAPPLPPPPASA